MTVTVEVPKGTVASIVPGSFNAPPTQTIVGTSSDTLVWRRSFAFGSTDFAFIWRSTLSNLQAGEIRNTTLGARVDSFVGSRGPRCRWT